MMVEQLESPSSAEKTKSTETEQIGEVAPIVSSEFTKELNLLHEEEENDIDEDVGDLQRNKRIKKKKLLDSEDALSFSILGPDYGIISLPYERQCKQRIIESAKQAMNNLRKEIHHLEDSQKYALNAVRLHRMLLIGMKVPCYKDQLTKTERKRLDRILHY